MGSKESNWSGLICCFKHLKPVSSMTKLDSVSPRPIMLKILPIMLLSSAQQVTYYAQYYTHIANYCNYATVNIQFYS